LYGSNATKMTDSSCSAVSVPAVAPGRGHHAGGLARLASAGILAGPGPDLVRTLHRGLVAVTAKHRILSHALLAAQ